MTRYLASPDAAQWLSDQAIPRMSDAEARADAQVSAAVLAENWAIARELAGASPAPAAPLDTEALARGEAISLPATVRHTTEILRVALLRPASFEEERLGTRVTVGVTKAAQLVQVVERHPNVRQYDGPHPQRGTPDLTITLLTEDDLRQRPPVVVGDADPRITPTQLLALAAERTAVPVARSAVAAARATGAQLSPTLAAAAAVTPSTAAVMPRRVARFLAEGAPPISAPVEPVPSVPLIPKSKSRGVQ